MSVKKQAPELEITKEMDIAPFARRKPAHEQPSLELPLPSSFPQTPLRQDEDTKEMNVRGVWEIDI
jgi:hypothetical protein